MTALSCKCHRARCRICSNCSGCRCRFPPPLHIRRSHRSTVGRGPSYIEEEDWNEDAPEEESKQNQRRGVLPQESTPVLNCLDMPNNQLPVLEIDGKYKLPQSLTIARYVARLYGMAGKDLFSEAWADYIVETFDDLHVEFGKTLNEKDEQKKAKLTRTFRETILPRFLNNLEKTLKTNCGGEGYFVGDSLTWADLQAYHILDITTYDWPEVLKDYPKLEGLKGRIENLPRIAEYLQSRPPSKI